MNKYDLNGEEQIELEEQAINEPKDIVTPEESEQETLNKRMEEADGREQDLADGWEPEL